MKNWLKIASLVVLALGLTSPSIAQDREQIKRSVGRANFYIAIKDQIGITEEQGDKLMSIEKDAIKELAEVSKSISETQKELNILIEEDEVNLLKVRNLLKKIGELEANAKFLIIATDALEKRVLSKEQREKAEEIARKMSTEAQKPQPSQQEQPSPSPSPSQKQSSPPKKQSTPSQKSAAPPGKK